MSSNVTCGAQKKKLSLNVKKNKTCINKEQLSQMLTRGSCSDCKHLHFQFEDREFESQREKMMRAPKKGFKKSRLKKKLSPMFIAYISLVTTPLWKIVYCETCVYMLVHDHKTRWRSQENDD